MATQVKFRRGSRTAHNTFTGAAGEMTVDTTNSRLVAHDGAKAGGFPHLNFLDHLKNSFKAAAGTLSAGVYSMTLDTAAAAYATYFEVIMLPNSNNAGAVDVNVNALGAKDIKKDNGSGTLVELSANDIKANIPVRLMYDGTRFILQGSAGAGGVKAIQWFTASGTYTPTAGATSAIVFCQAGGGEGGSGTGNTGGAGGTSSFGSYCSATGGSGGVGGAAGGGTPTAGAGGAGGTGSNGIVNIAGQSGGPGMVAQDASGTSSDYGIGGVGGNARFLGAGGFGNSAYTSNNGTAAAANSGSGGGGGNSNGGAGGGGGAGGLSIEYLSLLSVTTETVTVGAAGSGGSATGGDGAAGYVLILEF